VSSRLEEVALLDLSTLGQPDVSLALRRTLTRKLRGLQLAKIFAT
jgi:hypothetical protein